MYFLSSHSSSIFLGAAILFMTISGLFFLKNNQQLLTPGPMTHGHHQIELQCDACHGESEESMHQLARLSRR